MKPLRQLYLAAFGALALVGCSTLTHNPEGPGIVSFDHGATDTLVELGMEQKILAIPKALLPNYLAGMAADRADAGTLKVPDLQVIQEVAPELVLVTGRQSESHEALAKITRIQDVGLTGENFREALTNKVMNLASLYGVQDKAGTRLDELWSFVSAQRATIEDDPRVVIATHNKGKFSLRDEPVVSQLLALTRPDLPPEVESVTRGTRVFTPVTAQILADMAPDHLMVMDRSAAIGDEPLDATNLRQSLVAAGGGDIQVTLLSPDLWYLSGNGLQSTRLQILEVMEAL